MLGGGPGGGPGKAIASVPTSSGKAPTTKADILRSFNFIVSEKIQVMGLTLCDAPRSLGLMAATFHPIYDCAIPK
jgi:hypothetical protein